MSDWEAFADDLITALRSVSDRVFLIVGPADRPRAYVQFAGAASVVHAEVTGRLGDAPATPWEESVLEEHGWLRPHDMNWRDELPLPALSSEYAALAARCVAALRVRCGIKSPADLSYRAWREPEAAPPGVTWPEKRFAALDRGEDPLAFEALEPRVRGPEVAVVVPDSRGGRCHPSRCATSRTSLTSVSWPVCDRIREISPGSITLLGDHFTHLVREATRRWGSPQPPEAPVGDDAVRRRAWLLGSGAVFTVGLHDRCVGIRLTSPDGVASERASDEAYWEGY